jgi:Trk-type K+ transport system membrane component
VDNYAGMPEFAKWILSLDMFLGRLEIFNGVHLVRAEVLEKIKRAKSVAALGKNK